MPDFVYGGGSVPATKHDVNPPPGDTSGYLVAADVNLLGNNELSLRQAIIAGQYHGLVDTPSAPLSSAGGVSVRSNNGRVQFSQGGDHWADAAAYVNVLEKGADPTGVSDSGPAFSAAIATGLPVLVPDGNFLILTSVDVTNRTGGTRIIGQGITTKITAKCTGKAVFDLTGSIFVTIEGFYVLGDPTNVPSAAVLCARTTGDGSAGIQTFRDIRCDGNFSIGPYIGVSSEDNLYDNCFFLNQQVGANAMAIVSANLWVSPNFQYVGQPALTSAYAAISPTPAGGNTVHHLNNCRLVGNTSGADTTSTVLLIQNVRGLSFNSCFIQGYGAYGVYFKGTNQSVDLSGVHEDELSTTYGYYVEAGGTLLRFCMMGFISSRSFYADAGSVVDQSRIQGQFGFAPSPDNAYTMVFDTLTNFEVDSGGLSGISKTKMEDGVLLGNGRDWSFPTDTKGVEWNRVYLDLAGQVVHEHHINSLTNRNDRLLTKNLIAPAIQQTPQYLTGQSGNITPDFWTYGFYEIFLTGNAHINNPSSSPSGFNGTLQEGTRVTFLVHQDVTGGRSLTWDSAYQNMGFIALNPAPFAVSAIDFILAGDGNWWALTQVPTGAISGFDVPGTLTVDGGFLWAKHGRQVQMVTVSTPGTYTVLDSDDFIVIDASAGNITIDLPDAASYFGRKLHITRIDVTGGNTVTLQPIGGNLINSNASLTLAIQTANDLVCDGGINWYR